MAFGSARSFLRRLFASRGLALHDVAPEAEPEVAWYRPLTKREAEVAALILAGSTDREIARSFGADQRAVNVCVVVIMQKLGVHKRAEIAAWVRQHRPG